ncbi:hypothetical protein EDWATA_02996 [Edwardsiella tarda ATCC 23685]|uniref:Uncharacterized protein n=1 Tax=Edwardsiella tarda ATCC 23685 TaxID=500638 RepID=D4F8A8_EDWTA|nr:hypothetical protein EDWATA_02996 [Edwardsiella tarda ATCC 23685]
MPPSSCRFIPERRCGDRGRFAVYLTDKTTIVNAICSCVFSPVRRR